MLLKRKKKSATPNCFRDSRFVKVILKNSLKRRYSQLRHNKCIQIINKFMELYI